MTGFGRSIPDMFAKANRWIAEMEQIAGFLSEASAERDVYDAIAAFYKRIGADFDGDWREIGILETFLHLRDEGLKG
jgi:hypothetical protein